MRGELLLANRDRPYIPTESGPNLVSNERICAARAHARAGVGALSRKVVVGVDAQVSVDLPGESRSRINTFV